MMIILMTMVMVMIMLALISCPRANDPVTDHHHHHHVNYDDYDFNEDDYFDDNGDGYDNDDVGPDNSVCAFSHQKNYFCTKLRLFSQLRLLWRLLFTNIPLLFFNCLLMFCKYSPKLSLFIISFQLDSFSLLERCRFLLGSCIFLLLQGEDFFYTAR